MIVEISPVSEPAELARLARLRYVCDSEAGIERRKRGRGFIYVYRGRRVVDPRHLQRIQTLAIPPAWIDVWICRFANGHIQCTGRDDRQRKQYLYHQRWQDLSARMKFGKLLRFGQQLPHLRKRTDRDLSLPDDRPEKVMAAIVALLDRTSVRVGNEEYVQENGSYGLTTLRRRHVRVEGDLLRLRFPGKGGAPHDVQLRDKRLAQLVARYRACGGEMLFQCRDGDDQMTHVDSAHVNEYLRSALGDDFTAKDFRTWKASAIVAGYLYAAGDAGTQRAAQAAVRQAIGRAAETLGNTTTVCRNSYVHPALTRSYLAGTFSQRCRGFRPRNSKWMNADERILLHFLKALKPEGT